MATAVEDKANPDPRMIAPGPGNPTMAPKNVCLQMYIESRAHTRHQGNGNGCDKDLRGSQSKHHLGHGSQPLQTQLQADVEEQEHNSQFCQMPDFIHVLDNSQCMRTHQCTRHLETTLSNIDKCVALPDQEAKHRRGSRKNSTDQWHHHNAHQKQPDGLNESSMRSVRIREDNR